MTAQPMSLEQALAATMLAMTALVLYVTLVYYSAPARRPKPSVHAQIETMLSQYSAKPAKIVLPMSLYKQFRAECGRPADDGNGEWSPDMRIRGIPIVCGEVRNIVLEWKTDKNHV